MNKISRLIYISFLVACFPPSTVMASPVIGPSIVSVANAFGLTRYASDLDSNGFMLRDGITGIGSCTGQQGYVNQARETDTEKWLEPTADPSKVATSQDDAIDGRLYKYWSKETGPTDTKYSALETSNSETLLNFKTIQAGNDYIGDDNPALSLASFSLYDLSIAEHGWQDEADNSDLNGLFNSVSEVPEPATMLLFGIGLIGIATLQNRYRKN